MCSVNKATLLCRHSTCWHFMPVRVFAIKLQAQAWKLQPGCRSRISTENHQPVTQQTRACPIEQTKRGEEVSLSSCRGLLMFAESRKWWQPDSQTLQAKFMISHVSMGWCACVLRGLLMFHLISPDSVCDEILHESLGTVWMNAGYSLTLMIETCFCFQF